jgi:hypothetical protein
MKTTDDYKFEVSISDQSFERKPIDNEIKYLRFTKQTVDVYDFLNLMLEGHCYTGVYSYDSFGMKQKNNINFRCSYLVTVDVDHSKETMNEMIDRLEFKPTCAYTSYSDGLDGDSRFRLVYCFDEKIEGKEEYWNYVYTVLAANGLELDGKVIDEKSREAIQYYNGNGSANFDFAVSDIIYCKNDFNLYYKDYYILYNTTSNNNILYNKSVNKNYNINPNNNIHLNDTFENEEFENDYWNMEDGDILYKYMNVYPNLEHTPLEIPDDDTPYIIYPKDYIEINKTVPVGNKTIGVTEGCKLKRKDGQGRRRTLFWNGVLRRLINPQITFDNLLYNLLFEFYHYMTNYKAENKIGRRDIYQIAVNVMKQDMTKHEHLRNRPHKHFTTNPNYCAKHNTTRNKIKGTAGKMIRHKQIGELYDCSKTVMENVKIMKEYGLERISESTLKRWMKDNGITKYKKGKVS